MKTLNKIISLTMVVIILITASPVLQAADFFAALNKAELKELREEISSSLPEHELKILPRLSDIKQRYKKAIVNYKNNLKVISEDSSKKDIPDYEEYLQFLREEARKRIRKDARYDGFQSEEEKEQVAFYTILVEELTNAQQYKDDRHKERFNCIVDSMAVTIFVGLGLGMLVIYATDVYLDLDAGSVLLGMGTMFGVMAIGALIAVPAKPYFNFNLTPRELLSNFVANPFTAIAKFNTGATDDFRIVYSKSQSCAQALYDVVDIEYYTSLNPNLENIRARLYPYTIDWYEMTTEDRVDYLHNVAERLRAEAETNEETK